MGMSSKKNKTTSCAIGLKIDNEVCFDKETCAEKFNTFYTTVVSKLIEKVEEIKYALRHVFY